MAYRRCGVCHAANGIPCRVLSGHLVSGRGDGVPVELAEPHHARRLRAAGPNRADVARMILQEQARREAQS